MGCNLSCGLLLIRRVVFSSPRRCASYEEPVVGIYRKYVNRIYALWLCCLVGVNLQE